MPDTPLRVYSSTSRVATAVLTAGSRLSLPIIGVALGFVITTSVPLMALLRILTISFVLPAAVAWWIERISTVQVERGSAALTLHRAGLRIEVPYAAIARILPWRLPLPQPGFSLEMRSGKRLTYGLASDDPTQHISALAGVLPNSVASAAIQHPMLLYSRAKRASSRRWYHVAAKFGLFALLPTAVWFNAHQHIAYGGLLGQYYLEGLWPYVKTWLISWTLTSIYLVLYASVWRAIAEIVAWSAAWAAPAQTTRTRRVVEVVCGVAYYVGVPSLVLLPFVQ